MRIVDILFRNVLSALIVHFLWYFIVKLCDWLSMKFVPKLRDLFFK